MRSILEGDSGKKSAGYLFFENADGYNFRNMDAITQTAPSRSINVNFFEEDEDPDEDQKDINIFGFSKSVKRVIYFVVLI